MRTLLQQAKHQNYFIFEVFIVLRLFALMLPTIGKSLLIQDKICLFVYNQSAHFCENIHLEMENSTTWMPVKDQILADAAQFGSYTNMIESLAMVFWSLFVGSFNDKFWNGTVIVMFLNVFGDIFASTVNLVLVHYYHSSPYYILIASLSAWFSGAIMSFNATAYRYIAINIDEKYRRIKFIILEIIFVIDVSFATYLSGQVVKAKTSGPQLRTYERNFLITIAVDVVLVVLLCVLYRIEKHKNRNSKSECNEENIDSNNNGAAETSAKCTQIANLSSTIEQSPNQLPNAPKALPKESSNNFFIATLFDVENVKQTLVCFFKPRDHNVRLQIYLLCFVLFNQVLVTNGLNTVLLQFSEKVYHWSASTYSTWTAIQTISQMALLGVFVIFLIKLLKLQDRTLIVISQLSIFITDLIRGILLNPMAFFVSLPIGALTGIGAISVKSKISMVIPEDEVGKVFSISSTIEALVPFAASIIYSSIFSLSISTYPGVIYLFSCLVMCISLCIMMVEWCYCPVNSIKDFCTKEQENSA